MRCDIVTHLNKKISLLNQNLKRHCYIFVSSDEFMQPERQNQILWIYKLSLNISFFSFLFFFLVNNRKEFVSIVEISSLECSIDDNLAQDENEIT